MVDVHHEHSTCPLYPTAAMVGTWKKGPGADLFEALEAAIGQVPILAEDRGVITPDVVALREVGSRSTHPSFARVRAAGFHTPHTLDMHRHGYHFAGFITSLPPHPPCYYRPSARPAWSCCSLRGAAAPPTLTCRTTSMKTASSTQVRSWAVCKGVPCVHPGAQAAWCWGRGWHGDGWLCGLVGYKSDPA